jgi:hypothetical protein
MALVFYAVSSSAFALLAAGQSLASTVVGLAALVVQPSSRRCAARSEGAELIRTLERLGQLEEKLADLRFP